MKYLIILLVLVSIATVSCKKGPTEPTTTQYAIMVEVRDAGTPVDFSIEITKAGSYQKHHHVTPQDYSISISVPSETLLVLAKKTVSEGTLCVSFVNQATYEILRSSCVSSPFAETGLSFP